MCEHFIFLGVDGIPRRRRWENNIRINLREIWWEGLDWINLTQDMEGQVIVFCEHGNEHSVS
jgi:hypothetical protein